MTAGPGAEELFEDAPCGHVSTRTDGTIVRVNRTFEALAGRGRDELEQRRFHDLLTAGGRIYWETHCRPLLHMQGAVREIAVDLARGDGSSVPVLVHAVARGEGDGRTVQIAVLDATERRRYEQELLHTRGRERDIARLLQRRMLAGELPAAPDLEVGVSYRAAGNDLEAGGDWYDAFWLRDGAAAALAVGDVVGRGIDAAATMGQLRSAIRALAETGLEPAELLDALDLYVERHDVGRMTTLVYAQLDRPSGRLRYAAAGHPPPVLVPAHGEPRLLWEGRSAPLAVTVPARGAAECPLERGDAVLLYTDGLVERRGESLTEGLDRLLREASRRREEPVARLAETVVHALHERAASDDVCLLVARRPA